VIGYLAPSRSSGKGAKLPVNFENYDTRASVPSMTRFNPEVFRWARESAGLEPEEAARAIGIAGASLKAIEDGEKEPSRTMLSNMSRVYRRSLLTLYLSAPPQKGDRGEDFRTVAPEQGIDAEADVDALVRDLRARQRLVRAVLEDDEDARPLEFIGSATMAAGVPALREAIEKLLGITHTDYREQKDAEGAFNLLRDKAERAGAFVLLAGNLGSHHSTIPVGAFRGFAIADPLAPFIVINDGDAKAAWAFTLLHELAHLFLGTTGVSGGGVSEKRIERFCNEVASEFLLPITDLETINIAGLDMEEQIVLITQRADRWRVSRQMIAYGLYKAGRLSNDGWRALSTEIHSRWVMERSRAKEIAKTKKSSGPSYYIVRRHRLGPAMLDFARRSIDAGTLSPARAAKALGVKPRSVYPLLSIA
jgi:Zn-dependent peptidase ImmA (M78 family)/DNA-binding XRE family transcriptional regulator